jgi:uncharacterized protein with beta-barrel porin domain
MRILRFARHTLLKDRLARRTRLSLEQLDERIMPAINDFIGNPNTVAGRLWSMNANWQLGRPPNQGDEVTIGNNDIVEYSGGMPPIGSLANSGTGRLTVSTILNVLGDATIQQTRINNNAGNAELRVDGAITVAGGENSIGQGSRLRGSSTITISGSLLLEGGTIQVVGLAPADITATGSLSGWGTFSATWLTNAGTMTIGR